MVRVLAVADEVATDALSAGVLERLAPDVVLAAGDLPWDYLEHLVDGLEVPVVFVPGNHDPAVPNPDRRPRGALCADGIVVRAGGLRIAGLGGCVRYNAGPNQYTQRQYRSRVRRLTRRARRGGIDVLLTHAPPRGVGDGDDPAHVGIEALHRLVETLRPPWHVHGHIHPHGFAKPDRRLGDTTVVNVVPWRLMEVDHAP